MKTTAPLRRFTAAALAACCLAGTAYADGSLFVGQYLSDKNTTMTIQAAGQGLAISGRGEFSMYSAQCRMSSATLAVCQGTGTRLKDRKEYMATYHLTASPDGKRVTSSWVTTYDNGESYRGTTVLARVN